MLRESTEAIRLDDLAETEIPGLNLGFVWAYSLFREVTE